MSRPLTPRLIHIQPALAIVADDNPHYRACWRCWYKGLVWWTIDSLGMMVLLLAFAVPLVVLLALTACCGTRKNKSQLEEDLDNMVIMSPKALAARMPEAPTQATRQRWPAPGYSTSPIATRTRIRRRSQIAS